MCSPDTFAALSLYFPKFNFGFCPEKTEWEDEKKMAAELQNYESKRLLISNHKLKRRLG